MSRRAPDREADDETAPSIRHDRSGLGSEAGQRRYADSVVGFGERASIPSGCVRTRESAIRARFETRDAAVTCRHKEKKPRYQGCQDFVSEWIAAFVALYSTECAIPTRALIDRR